MRIAGFRLLLLISLLLASACTAAAVAPTASVTLTSPAPESSATVTQLPTPVPTLTPLPSQTPSPSPSPSPTSLPTVESLTATVTTDLLSCRYGPGPDYLFLYGLKRGASITLIGRTDGDNWHWVYVEGLSKCWVNAALLNVQGNWMQLPVVYPGATELPVSPYYPPTTLLSTVRKENQVTIRWADVPLRPGDEEDSGMLHYIVEVWHCENGRLLFEPLATNELSITVTDQPGCSLPSHGRILVQEKHGFAGPTEIPWPPFQ